MAKIQICMYVVCLACSVIFNVLLLSNYVYVGRKGELSWSSRSSGSSDMLKPKLFLAQSRQTVKGQKSSQTNECAKTVISRPQRLFQTFQRILMTQHFIRCLSFFLLSSQNTISQIPFQTDKEWRNAQPKRSWARSRMTPHGKPQAQIIFLIQLCLIWLQKTDHPLL